MPISSSQQHLCVHKRRKYKTKCSKIISSIVYLMFSASHFYLFEFVAHLQVCRFQNSFKSKNLVCHKLPLRVPCQLVIQKLFLCGYKNFIRYYSHGYLLRQKKYPIKDKILSIVAHKTFVCRNTLNLTFLSHLRVLPIGKRTFYKYIDNKTRQKKCVGVVPSI